MTIVRFKTDESIELAVELTEGDWTTVTATASAIRKEATAAPLIPMTVTVIPPAGSDPARWKLSLPAGLPVAGKYVVDARFTVAGCSYVTETISIVIEPVVTPR